MIYDPAQPESMDNLPRAKFILLICGFAIMMIAVVLLIFGPDLSGRVITGIILMFLVGFGMTVGGSPTPRSK